MSHASPERLGDAAPRRQTHTHKHADGWWRFSRNLITQEVKGAKPVIINATPYNKEQSEV